MSEKLRSVNTKFWDDPFVENLSPSEKLLFLYLLTNPLANLLGIYEITIKRICYDTGLNKETVTNGLKQFGTVRKAFYYENFIILPNWLKNQNLNKNMKIAVAREFNSLPTVLKDSILRNGSEGLSNDSEGFRMVMECLGKYEIEIEDEIESEAGVKKESPEIKLKSEVWQFIDQYPESLLKDFLNYWTEKSKSGKLRFQSEKYFEVSRRLATWASRDKNFNKQPEKIKPQFQYGPES
jgi:hypothetical protein